MATDGRINPSDTVEGKLRQYEIYVTEAIDDEYNYDTDSLLTLILRDDIEKHLGEFTRTQREKLDGLDKILASKHEWVAVILPSDVEHDRKHWWWFLHEGPQAREQALSES